MPTLHNPAAHRLACYRIGRILDAGETVEITDEEAEDLRHGTVFIVEGAQERKQADPAAQADAEDGTQEEDEPDEPEASSTPKRETVRRGGKRAEVTKAPEAETRG